MTLSCRLPSVQGSLEEDTISVWLVCPRGQQQFTLQLVWVLTEVVEYTIPTLVTLTIHPSWWVVCCDDEMLHGMMQQPSSRYLV